MTPVRFAAALLSTVLIISVPARAQSVAGKWQGSVTSQNGTQDATITFDSTAIGWQGNIVVPDLGVDASPFTSVTVHADSITMTLPYQNVTITFRGHVTADMKTLSGQLLADDNDAGSFTFSRPAPAAPAKPPA
jgi:hypothetical protein